jgi:hypothetical protein
MFARTLKGLTLILLVPLVMGCSDNLSTDIAPPQRDIGYYVIGVEPSDVQLRFDRVKLDGDRAIEQGPELGYRYTPVDGFIVGEARGPYSWTLHSTDFGNPLYGANDHWEPPADSEHIVFDVPAGTVVYITNMQFRKNGNTLSIYGHSDIAAARAFLRKHFPQLADKLEQGHYVSIRQAPRF